MKPDTQPDAAHAACELGMDDADDDFPGVPAWVAVTVVAVCAVIASVFMDWWAV